MKFIIILLFAAISASAQTDGVLYFAMHDGTGHKILPSHYWKISAGIQDGDTLPVRYVTSDTAFILVIPANAYNKLMHLQLAYTAGTYTGIMNVYFKAGASNANGTCNTCAITDMEYRPGNFMLDLPLQKESWDFLETFNCNVDGKTIALKNISMLQNWSEPNLK